MTMTNSEQRQRFWGITQVGDIVLVRHYPVIAPGEELTENTPTIRLTRAEWLERHTEWGMNADGTPMEEVH